MGEQMTTAERDAYVPPPCPVCGGRTIQDWVPVRGFSDTQDYWTPGRYHCASGKH